MTRESELDRGQGGPQRQTDRQRKQRWGERGGSRRRRVENDRSAPICQPPNPAPE